MERGVHGALSGQHPTQDRMAQYLVCTLALCARLSLSEW